MKLAAKTCFLVLMATGCRKTELLGMDVDHFQPFQDRWIFDLQRMAKTFAPNNPDHNLNTLITRKNPNSKLCPVEHLKHYMKRTVTCRSSTQLFISCVPPYAEITGQRITKWIKLILSQIGITDGSFQQSTRSVVSSSLFDKGAPIDSILKQCKWKSASTFYRHYYRHNPSLSQASFCQNKRKIYFHTRVSTKPTSGHLARPSQFCTARKRPIASGLSRPITTTVTQESSPLCRVPVVRLLPKTPPPQASPSPSASVTPPRPTPLFWR